MIEYSSSGFTLKSERVVDKIHANYLQQLLPGIRLQLQFSRPSPARLHARLVGYEAGRYLLIRLTESDHWRRYMNHLLEENEVVVRMRLDEARAEFVAFKSCIKWRGYSPVNMLYLHFPNIVERCDLRAHPRVATCFAASLSDAVVRAGGQVIQGCIKDVSLGGCCFEFPLPDNKAALSPKTVMVRTGNNVEMLGEVKNQREGSENRLAIGLKFRHSVNEIKSVLHRLYIAPEHL